MHAIARDLRHAVRQFARSPGFTAVALVTLALGIGATTAIFSVVDAVLWKPLPFRDPSHLLILWERNPSLHKFRMKVAPFNFREWESCPSLAGVAAFLDTHANLTGGPNGAIEPEELNVERISARMFPLLGVQPLVGRAFRPEEDQPGNSTFALLSYSLWRRRFAADPAIAGKTIRLRDQSYVVLGVMPPRFALLDSEIDLWTPLAFNMNDPRVLGGRILTVIGRPKPGMSFERVRADLEAIGDRGQQINPQVDTGWRPSPFPLSDELLGNVTKPLLVLLGAVGLMLLMACVNVANLLLARASVRGKEVAVRTALGAGRGRIMAQLLVEGLLLSLAGGVLGVLLAWVGIRVLIRLGSGQIPRLGETTVDAGLLLFALGVSVATGVLFGLAPAWFGSRANLNLALREGGTRGATSQSGRNLRRLLVAGEIALAVVVMIASGLLIRSFARLRAVNPGFQPTGLLTFRLPLSPRLTPERRINFMRQVMDRVHALPGVTAVGAVDTLPVTRLGDGTTFAIQGRPEPPLDQRPIALIRNVNGDYFRAMGIPLLAGRNFSEADTPKAPMVAAINQTMARRFWPNGNPLGASLLADYNNTAFQIVAVVGDVKPERMDGDEWPTIYLPYSQITRTFMSMVARTAGDPISLASAVRQTVQQLDPTQPLAEVRPMDAVMDQSLASARFQTVIMGLFALLAFSLASVGIYGLISYDVTERTRELGIRMALGAESRHILRLVLGQGARLAALGIGVGLAAAVPLTGFMASMLFGVRPGDAYTFSMIPILLGVVALAASYLPSRRAVSVDAVTALRHE
ncbi:MAG TPA: ABC transporter permease [Verrucomicrobiae bacterium]|nr:ABC transporter permease [Verrucomicrobiae bacterium]